MCGIAGIVSKKDIPEPDSIKRIVAAIKHRGPDETGYFIRDFVQMGMCRLSILDLKSEGLCPFVYQEPDSKMEYVTVYNGEIYNYIELRDELKGKGHQFRSTCDVEVLLHAYLEWGEDCLDRFNGMFAFAILDYSRDHLFLARDRAGEKPLYYYHDSEGFIFSSEIKGILTQIDMPDLNLSDQYKALEFMAEEESLFSGIKSLLPGHKMIYKGIRNGYRGRKISEYWNVLDTVRQIDPENAVDEFDYLLNDSVRLRLRSDVPLGLYLSGGLDSALIAYMAKPSICFSCNFDYGPKYDELEYATLVARDIEAEHVIVRPNQKEFEQYLPDIMYHLDMPVGSFSPFPLFMLARTARDYVKIILSGEGADELFTGYTRYLILAHEQEIFQFSAMKNYHPLLDYYFGPPLDRFARLLNRGNTSNAVVKSIIGKYFDQFDDAVHAMGYTEFKLLLVTLLQMEDRTSSAFGLENRSPFLDHRLIEFAFSIDSKLKVRNKTPKWILRELAKRYLPQKLLDRQDKKGLVAPVNLWLHTTGNRGEFDRQHYNEVCREKWLGVFFEERRFKKPRLLYSLPAGVPEFISS